MKNQQIYFFLAALLLLSYVSAKKSVQVGGGKSYKTIVDAVNALPSGEPSELIIGQGYYEGDSNGEIVIPGEVTLLAEAGEGSVMINATVIFNTSTDCGAPVCPTSRLFLYQQGIHFVQPAADKPAVIVNGSNLSLQVFFFQSCLFSNDYTSSVQPVVVTDGSAFVVFRASIFISVGAGPLVNLEGSSSVEVYYSQLVANKIFRTEGTFGADRFLGVFFCELLSRTGFSSSSDVEIAMVEVAEESVPTIWLNFNHLFLIEAGIVTKDVAVLKAVNISNLSPAFVGNAFYTYPAPNASSQYLFNAPNVTVQTGSNSLLPGAVSANNVAGIVPVTFI